MSFTIYIDDKPARGLMLRNKTKRITKKYFLKVDNWFGTSGKWMSDEDVEKLL